METLTKISCPFEVKDKYGNILRCNKTCVKVESGSKGEAYCWRCKLRFNFEVDSQSNYKPKIVVQRENT